MTLYYERFRWDLENLEKRYKEKLMQCKIDSAVKQGKKKEKAEEMKEIYERALNQCKIVLSKWK